MIDLELVSRSLNAFCGDGLLAHKIAQLEGTIENACADEVDAILSAGNVDESVLGSALTLKEVAGQINVVIHAVGILMSLPHILESRETVIYASLGAGNIGKEFDLVTDRRVAEFKFINWQGGAEAIRQNQLFKDFFYLAEYKGDKRRCMYVLDTRFPLKFLNGRRALSSVLSRNRTLRDNFYAKYGEKYSVVSEYYRDSQNRVELINLSNLVPCFSAHTWLEVADGEDSDE